MLTPKCPPRDFRVGSDPRFPHMRLWRLSDAVTEGKSAGNRPKKGGSVKHYFSFYINDLDWLCCEAAANVSRQSNSLICGKIQGNSARNRVSATLGASFHKGFRVNYLLRRTGKYWLRTGNVPSATGTALTSQ